MIVGFDVKSYLRDRGIEFLEKGKNIMREHVGIRCVVCDDKSKHLNIKVDGTHALCFRCKVHVFGIKKVLELLEGRRMNTENAFKIAVRYFSNEIERSFKSRDNVNVFEDNLSRKKKLYEFFYTECNELRDNSVYVKYLEKRGISFDFAKWFGIREGRKDEWRWYVVVPVRDEKGELVSFVGRLACNSKSGVRYKNASRDMSMGYRGLFGIWECKELGLLEKGYLFVVEGVFDVLKLLQEGVPAVGLMTKNVSDEQLVQMVRYVSADKNIVIGLDADVDVKECYDLKNRFLMWFDSVVVLGFGGREGDVVFDSDKKDFGDMDKDEIKKLKKFIEKMLKKGVK